MRETIETVLLALLVFLSVKASFQNFRVEGQSMAPTLNDGQFLIVNKLVYSEIDTGRLSDFLWFIDTGDDGKRHVFHAPERGDIVVLHDPAQPGQDLIKRVIGLPGETVEIRTGVVYIDGRQLIEPYIVEPWPSWSMQATAIPERSYFVLGDNRNNSNDSRFQQIGLIPEDLIVGKAMFSYWPRSDFGFAPNEEPGFAE
ncbi:MAG: signal peptidase I [Dehalococcoidia bacterium]|nr:signal peptidase I [Dehalococcoidia bacterium]